MTTGLWAGFVVHSVMTSLIFQGNCCQVYGSAVAQEIGNHAIVGRTVQVNNNDNLICMQIN